MQVLVIALVYLLFCGFLGTISEVSGRLTLQTVYI